MTTVLTSQKSDLTKISLIALIYIGLYLLFYPAIFAYRDEANYFAMAYVLKQGTLLIDQTSIPVQAAIESLGHLVPIYPIGNSIGLLPFTFFPWQSVFLYGILCHLIAAFMIYRLASIFKINAFFPTVLYLFYPSLTLYSRTLMSDVPTVAIFLSACVYYFDANKKKWAAGLLFGLMLLLRPTNLLLVIPFAICLTIRTLINREVKVWTLFFLAMAPFAALVGLFNHYLYGSPLANGYTIALPDLENFAWDHFVMNSKHYLLNLNLAYPLMLVLFFFVRELRKPEIWLLVIGLPIFFSFHYFYDRFPNPWMDTFFSNRFLFPAIAFLILAYGKAACFVLQRLSKNIQKILSVILIACLVLGTLLIHQRHTDYLSHQVALRDLIYNSTNENDVVIFDEHTAELIQAPWGKRVYVDYPGYEELLEYMKQLDGSTPIYLIQRKFIYNQEEHVAMTDMEIEAFSKLYPLKVLSEMDGMTIYSVSVKRGV